MKKLQTAGRSAAARSLMASAGALSLLVSSLATVPAAFAAPEASTNPTATASASTGAQAVDANTPYEDLTYAPAPDPAQVERNNPAMGAGERERLGTANARTGATSAPASAATLSGLSAGSSSAQALAPGRSAWTPSGG
ncbi:MAG: glycoside hydrolase family 25, partial [Rothia mucilaginosa]|nr:glycoside hydrolase family 25 [Rothia mucilaginosa]